MHMFTHLVYQIIEAVIQIELAFPVIKSLYQPILGYPLPALHPDELQKLNKLCRVVSSQNIVFSFIRKRKPS